MFNSSSISSPSTFYIVKIPMSKINGNRNEQLQIIRTSRGASHSGSMSNSNYFTILHIEVQYIIHHSEPLHEC